MEFDRAAARERDKPGHESAKRVAKFLFERVAKLDNPRRIGEALKGSGLGDFWKYRVGDYRIIVDIQDAARCVR
ncbi:MAG: type II toxin-antitoxin system mRNA interferase toxin, RelE/StbE family [Rhodanobacter sp.]|nr:MAG: type II toxin-antitoxin system mRNA interferase toxin, RelE/StbE family [Rhodanobacter sp.]TAM38731.1 MAG: type II toxin-antitoxin system mRNA interferase toxin, RelE/StbE family [Rhodanobacter sp.]TAN23258.1 MAG: type II toxin-antitoxin system mRNA interferase toxin, RelE/StbE family [Rhodanobacter sp.]